MKTMGWLSGAAAGFQSWEGPGQVAVNLLLLSSTPSFIHSKKLGFVQISWVYQFEAEESGGSAHPDHPRPKPTLVAVV